MEHDSKLRIELIRLAINLLDSQDGIDIETFDYLKGCLVQEGGRDCRDILDNVSILHGKAFLNEDWVEENFARFEK